MSIDLVTIGLITGITYGLLGIGITLIYRLSGTLNLAQGDIGAFGGAVVMLLAVRYGWPLPIALLVGVLGGAVIGGLTEIIVMKRLGNRSAVVLMVATLGVGQLVTLLRVSLPGVEPFAPFPTVINAPIEIGPVDLTGAESSALIIAPIVAVVVWWVLSHTTAGAVVRATAANREATRLAGIDASLVSTMVWVAAGAIAVVATTTAVPLRGGTAVALASVGPGLLLRGFAASAIGRLHSIPMTLVGGLVLGVGEAMAINYFTDPGVTNLVVFVLVVIGLARLPRQDSDDGTRVHDVGRPWSDWPSTMRVQIARFAPTVMTISAIVALPFFVTSAGNTFQLARLAVLVLIVAATTVLAGWSGQVSLAQYALAGIGAIVSARLIDAGATWETSLVGAAVVAAVAAALVALPTSRLRGSQLAIATLGLSVMAPAWLFRQGITGAEQVLEVPRVDFGVFDLVSQRAYYLFVVAVVAVMFLVLTVIGRRATGRRWRAVRDNERAAAAFGISAWRTRVAAFALSGGLAGLGGGLLAGLLVTFRRGEFTPEDSIEIVVMAVIGGLGSLGGAILGVVYVGALPAFFSDLSSLQLLVSGVGLLVLLMYFPDGLASIVRRAQAALAGPPRPRGHAEVSGERIDATAPATPLDGIVERLTLNVDRHRGGAAALSVVGIEVRFGAVAAVEDVDLTVRAGEIVGLIGANGAGKSTLLNAISGLQPARGRVELGGRDISRLGAERRARLGIGRTFQDARLFPNLTVRETVLVAAATRERDSVMLDALVPAIWRGTERRLAERADAAIGLTGLSRFVNEPCAVLSTGTRRIVEVACLVASAGHVLLLDEPTAGLAQREVEQFPPILHALREHLGATVVIVEHDVAMLSHACDRLVCLEAGFVIADGPPEQVRHDPRVIESYLGPDAVAISRSGVVAADR